ncbi:MAG TPA: oxidoreductase [Luteitalea sp.]|nr:oxidoreductase [Luteitalea sp.]
MSDTSIGVALIGYGFAGEIFHAPFITTTPGLALRVVSSRQTARVAATCPGVTVVPAPAEAINRDDVTLVVVATPNDSHAPLVEQALAAGKHVVVDKPFTVTIEESRRVAAAATTADRRLAVFHNRRWDSDFLAVEQAVASGAIGDVVECRSEIGRWRPAVRDRWRERPGPGAGLWYDLGPHLVHQALTLFGWPTGIDAALRSQRAGSQTDDWFHVRLEYPGRDVLLDTSVLAADGPPRFVVRGTTGTLVKRGIDQQEKRLMAGERPAGDEWGRDDDPLLLWDGSDTPKHLAVPNGHYGRFYSAMRDAIATGAPVPVSAGEAIDVMAILMAGFESSTTGRVVRPDRLA